MIGFRSRATLFLCVLTLLSPVWAAQQILGLPDLTSKTTKALDEFSYILETFGGREYWLQQTNSKAGDNGGVRFGFDKLTGEQVAVKRLFNNDKILEKYGRQSFDEDTVEATKRGMIRNSGILLLVR